MKHTQYHKCPQCKKKRHWSKAKGSKIPNPNSDNPMWICIFCTERAETKETPSIK